MLSEKSLKNLGLHLSTLGGHYLNMNRSMPLILENVFTSVI